jgi:hypothetical protein
LISLSEHSPHITNKEIDMSKEQCEHFSFISYANVFRLTDIDNGPVTGYSVEVKVQCSDCGMPFGFVGVDQGISTYKPMVSFDRKELRAPIVPAEEL